jgi:hypothetical protein
MANVTIPYFNFAAFYYAQILEALIEFKRVNVPEHTDESPQDPLMQTLSAFALVGHLNNVNIDTTANESTLPTARLAETVRNQLRLIGYELASAAPSSADIIGKLTQPLAASSNVILAYAQVATKRTATEASVVFEILSTLISPASALGFIGGVLAYDKSSGNYTDYTDEANNGDPFTPWGTPIAGDILYIGHSRVMWDKLGIAINTPGSGLVGIWEYYDGSYLDGKPTYKERISAHLRFGVNSVLGTSARPGSLIRVQLDKTGVWEEVESSWGVVGGVSINYIDTGGLLGQTAPAADASDLVDYSIGSVWKELTDVIDGSANLTVSGDVEFALPENLTEQWLRLEVYGSTLYWLRYRILSVVTPTAPILAQLRIDEGGQYVKTLAVQGQRQRDLNLGVGDGVTPDQECTMTKDGFIDESEVVSVDSIVWARVDNFLQSGSTDRHYKIVLGAGDRATVVFGNGVNGSIPSGQIDVIYRYGVTTNGNVGANSIVVDKSGLSYLSDVWNPRPAIGWRESESASPESLELAKVLGPASFRNVLEVALGPRDVEVMTIAYTSPGTNTRPFIRSHAIEESFGPKTIGNVVVAAGGGAAPAEILIALNKYFNGDKTVSPPLRKRVVANQEVTSLNYTPKTINISAIVHDAADLEAVEYALQALLQPDARKDDGVTFEWNFGDDIFISRIYHEIHTADSLITQIEDLLINGSSVNVTLGENELPVAGTITLISG